MRAPEKRLLRRTLKTVSGYEVNGGLESSHGQRPSRSPYTIATLTPASRESSMSAKVCIMGSPVFVKNAPVMALDEEVKFSGTPRSSCTQGWLKKAVL